MKPRKSYSELDIPDWEWMHFLEYWEFQYKVTLKQFPPRHEKVYLGRSKGMITNSVKLRGNELFKEMIDWFFENRKSMKLTGEVTLGILCGNHSLSDQIAILAENELENRKIFE